MYVFDCWLLVLYGSSRVKHVFLLDVDDLAHKPDVYGWCYWIISPSTINEYYRNAMTFGYLKGDTTYRIRLPLCKGPLCRVWMNLGAEMEHHIHTNVFISVFLLPLNEPFISVLFCRLPSHKCQWILHSELLSLIGFLKLDFLPGLQIGTLVIYEPHCKISIIHHQWHLCCLRLDFFFLLRQQNLPANVAQTCIHVIRLMLWSEKTRAGRHWIYN